MKAVPVAQYLTRNGKEEVLIVPWKYKNALSGEQYLMTWSLGL
jgi:hypothetical protein